MDYLLWMMISKHENYQRRLSPQRLFFLTVWIDILVRILWPKLFLKPGICPLFLGVGRCLGGFLEVGPDENWVSAHFCPLFAHFLPTFLAKTGQRILVILG